MIQTLNCIIATISTVQLCYGFLSFPFSSLYLLGEVSPPIRSVTEMLALSRMYAPNKLHNVDLNSKWKPRLQNWALGFFETPRPKVSFEAQWALMHELQMLLKVLHIIHTFQCLMCVTFTWYRWMLLCCCKWGCCCSRIPVLFERCWGFDCSNRPRCCKLNLAPFSYSEWHWVLAPTHLSFPHEGHCSGPHSPNTVV